MSRDHDLQNKIKFTALKSRCSSGVERFLGKEEATGSNPVIGSTDNQQDTKGLSISKIILANYERTFAFISLFLFLSIQTVKIMSYDPKELNKKIEDEISRS